MATGSPLILVVDDSPIQRKIYTAALKAEGYEVVTGTNGHEGVELALRHSPALILMDIGMPEMDGLAAVRELRHHPETAQLPVLAITALSEPDELEAAYQAGYSDVVDKNSDHQVLMNTVRQWLSG
jgi:CheY-like chemotaxis protein